MIRNATVPEGVPALRWPNDLHGYLLVPGRKYHRLAQADRANIMGQPEGMSILCFVEFAANGAVLIYKADGWKKRGRSLSDGEVAEWMPYVRAAKAWLDGVGPATWVAERTVDVGDGYVGRRVETAPIEGWTLDESGVHLGRGLSVWTHTETGAVIEDHTYNVPDAPARGADAEVAYRGFGPFRMSQRFPTFAQAAEHALAPVDEAV